MDAADDAAALRASAQELQELVQFLHGVPLWAEVPWDRLLPVAAAMVRIDAERGEVVLRQGELLRGMYVVASGRCRAERDVSIDGAPPPSPPSPPPGLDDDDDDAADAAAAAAPPSRVARVFVRTMARRECFGDVAMLLPRALLKKSRRARETVTAEVATTVYFLPKSEAPAVELGPNGQREARLSVLLAPSDASLQKWEQMILRRLGGGWDLCTNVTLWEMRLGIFAREELLTGDAPLIRGVQTARSRTGIGGFGGNKGGLVVALKLGHASLCFVSCAFLSA